MVWSFALQGQVGEDASLFAVHMTVQSVLSGTKPHQNDLLLPGQQVIVIPL